MSGGKQDQRTSSQSPPSSGTASGASIPGPGKRTLVDDLAPAASTATRSLASTSGDRHAAGSRTDTANSAQPALQRKETSEDAALLEHQASLKGTDVEIPAIEGALLATRQEAVTQGLLSKPSFDASLSLTRAMTKLQPVVAAGGAVDGLSQEMAAIAAQQLFFALQRETADSKNFKIAPSPLGGTAVTSQNPYTAEVRVTTYFIQNTASSLEQLPALIRRGQWVDAFRDYRRMLEGLDHWVADQLRRKGKGTPEEALGDAQQHFAQLRTGLEQIAGKHAKRLPALFHPDPSMIAKEKSAGHPVVDTIPMNVYFWKDDADGKYHLYDLTTPSRPHEQTIDGPPTAAILNTFFEEVARYPEGDVQYTLPGGDSGVAATTGKTKWYEWVAYAGLAIAAVGLALATAGASVPATFCFAAGAIAGGVSAAGHLADTTHLGTATTATIVLDVAQLATSFATFGALSITLKAGSATAALANSRWFVPLVGGAAAADGVQLVALTDITFVELTKVQNGAGTPEDKQRAISVLLTQLIVAGGLTALSVQGARSARALAGQQLEVVDQGGMQVLRVTGDDTATAVRPSDGAAENMRWQMEHKNKQLVGKAQEPRYPDVDAAVQQGMDDLAKARTRGYPYGFSDRSVFEKFGQILKARVASQPAPSGGIPVPTSNAVVQGSAVYRPSPGDVDVALLVSQEQFDKLIEQSFTKEIAKVRSRGVDPLRMTMSDARSAAERTLANAVETGIIKRDKVLPRLSNVRDELEAVTGLGVDLSIVKRGGQFDRGPYFPIP